MTKPPYVTAKFTTPQTVRENDTGELYRIVSGPPNVTIEPTGLYAYVYIAVNGDARPWLVRAQGDMESGRFELVKP